MVARRYASQYGDCRVAVCLLVVGVEHLAVVVRLPLPPLIIAFKRELYSFIFYKQKLLVAKHASAGERKWEYTIESIIDKVPAIEEARTDVLQIRKYIADLRCVTPLAPHLLRKCFGLIIRL